jgi:hypothetical protein
MQEVSAGAGSTQLAVARQHHLVDRGPFLEVSDARNLIMRGQQRHSLGVVGCGVFLTRRGGLPGIVRRRDPRQATWQSGDSPRMQPADSIEKVSVSVDLSYRDYVDAQFLRQAWEERLTIMRGAGWITRAELADAPGELLGGAEYFHGSRNEALVRIEGALCQLILQERSLFVRTAARSPEHAERALAAVAAALPEVDDRDREVSARFWWWNQHGPAELARMLPSPPWDQIDDNYVTATRLRLDELCRWEQPPAGGRLLLWHGEPGTGKTNAIRSLLGEWRSWAEFQFVTDPESFLSNPGYLLATIGGPQRIRPTKPNRWRIVVLEDAGEFLGPDAKHLKGQALSRLLNVCDGVLGQAMRALVLVTTNEPIAHLHPALARSGRCLSQIAFERFGRREILEWCSDHAVAPPDGQAATLAELYAHLNGRPIAPHRHAVGFAPAAARSGG